VDNRRGGKATRSSPISFAR